MLEDIHKFTIVSILVVALCYCITTTATPVCPNIRTIDKFAKTFSNDPNYVYPDIKQYANVCTAPYIYQSQEFDFDGRKWALLLVDVSRKSSTPLHILVDAQLDRLFTYPEIIWQDGHLNCVYKYSKPFFIAITPPPDLNNIAQQVNQLREERDNCTVYG